MPYSQLSRWIAMANTRPKGRVAAAVREKVLADKCLIDGCDHPPTRRGLCTRHYHLFLKTLEAEGPEKAAELEQQLIKDGLVLPVGLVRAIRNPNPFKAEASA